MQHSFEYGTESSRSDRVLSSIHLLVQLFLGQLEMCNVSKYLKNWNEIQDN